MNTYKRYRFPPEIIRLWCIKFGAKYARRLKHKHRGFGDPFYIDEVFEKSNGKQHYLWRSVDQNGEVLDVFLQAQRFLGVHGAVRNLFNLGRHLIRAEHYRNLREGAFGQWVEVVA